MNSLNKILSVFAIFAAVASAQAQQTPAVGPQESAGLLGKRSANLGFAYTDVKHSSTDAYLATTSVNLPVNANLDVTATYDYNWVESNGSSHASTFSVSATSYMTAGTVKPFATVGLGYNWPKNFAQSERLVYNTAVGIEIDACKAAALVFAVENKGDFKNSDNSIWSAKVGTNIWINKDVAALLSVSLLERGHLQYSLGVAYRF